MSICPGKVAFGRLCIDKSLFDLVNKEIAPGTGVKPAAFWTALEEIIKDLGPKNEALLRKRDELQAKIDSWYQEHHDPLPVAAEQKRFLTEIGYLVPEGGDFQIEVTNVDAEIATIAGPQLVVPVKNARYALNAANARWGSLYDSLYGTDVIDETDGAKKNGAYNPVRGQRVIEYAKKFLDDSVPLARGHYADVIKFLIKELDGRVQLIARLQDDQETSLADSQQFIGYLSDGDELTSILVRHNSLHIEIQIDPSHPVGREDPAAIKDILMESATTTIQDFEDAVAAVDAEDKVLVYRNWLGLMKGDLETTFKKGDQIVTRHLAPDRVFKDPNGGEYIVPGRSLMLVRNVSLHMYTDAVTTQDEEEIPERFLDAMVSVMAAIHDLNGNSEFRNSRAGSVYIVVPKLHGPEEVAATVELFARVEDALGLDRNTIKIGIMDEERRTTVNLKECIRAARERVIFINTGFLDRTGDEIRTFMEGGPVIPKPEIKNAKWIQAYEDWNVDIGIETGFPGTAQIGKGMWAAPDSMKAMVETKIGHPRAGANTAWVPSPTAATLHAMHYHQEDVFARQQELAQRERAKLEDIITPPFLNGRQLSPKEIQQELDNNAQGILGYVVRWVGQGIGCSKVPDIQGTGLMEDRATLRIASQHIANWLHHGVVSKDQVMQTLYRMAKIVDEQNSRDPNYRRMSDDPDKSIEFQAACDMIFKGLDVPNGYTEPVLHSRRRQLKEVTAEVTPEVTPETQVQVS